MPTKDEAVQELVDWHFEVDPEITEIYRFLGPNEDDPREPIKLLDVTTGTLVAGRVMTFGFGPTPEIPYSTVVATITPEEMEQIARQQMPLPSDWNLNQAQRFSAPTTKNGRS